MSAAAHTSAMALTNATALRFSIRKRLGHGPLQLRLSLDAEIPAGGFAGVYGPSGAGKTSLFRMISGLLAPDDGRIDAGGDVWFDSGSRTDAPARSRSIGFVFQDAALFPAMTVAENVAFALPREDRSDKSGAVGRLLAATRAEMLADRKPATLSGGEKQRVALARALARRPKVLLLDEPFSALDRKSRLELQETLLAVHREFGTTTLLASHDIAEIFRFSDLVLRIEEGTVAGIGPPAAILGGPTLSAKFRFTGRVVAIDKSDIVYVVSALVGNEITRVIAMEADVRDLSIGNEILISSKAFNPIIHPL
jgi:molybdate transport system ATP-binding protein